jgi:hypothetical protein
MRDRGSLDAFRSSHLRILSVEAFAILYIVVLITIDPVWRLFGASPACWIAGIDEFLML